MIHPFATQGVASIRRCPALRPFRFCRWLRGRADVRTSAGDRVARPVIPASYSSFTALTPSPELEVEL